MLRKLSIISSTLLDRAIWRIGSKLHPPKGNRRYLTYPVQILSEFGYSSASEMEEYANRLNEVNLPSEINSNFKAKRPGTFIPFVESKFDMNSPIDSWLDVLSVLYILIRCNKPTTIIETGIGEIGASSTYILQALSDNKKGRLFSIDPDKYYDVFGFHVGSGIPERLRIRHTFVRGMSQTSLSETIQNSGKIDMFLHDGDHRYRTKLYEYRTIYRNASDNAIIISDDTNDSAWDVFVFQNRLDNLSLRYGDTGFFSMAKTKSTV